VICWNPNAPVGQKSYHAKIVTSGFGLDRNDPIGPIIYHDMTAGKYDLVIVSYAYWLSIYRYISLFLSFVINHWTGVVGKTFQFYIDYFLQQCGIHYWKKLHDLFPKRFTEDTSVLQVTWRIRILFWTFNIKSCWIKNEVLCCVLVCWQPCRVYVLYENICTSCWTFHACFKCIFVTVRFNL